MNIQPFSQTGQMIEPCCENLPVRCIWLYVLIMACTCFRVNLHYSCLNVKELHAQNRRCIWCLSDSNRNQTQNHLVHEQTLNHLAKLAKWLSCVVATTECRFTLKRACDMIRTYSQMHCTDKFSQHSSTIWPVCLNSGVFVYKISGCEFDSCCSHLKVTSATKLFFVIK